MRDNTKTVTLTDRLATLQSELTLVNQALLTAAGGEYGMLEAWAATVRRKIAALTGARSENR